MTAAGRSPATPRTRLPQSPNYLFALRYSYAGCDPVNHTDPTGLISAGCVQSVVGLVGGITAFIGAAISFASTHLGGPASVGAGLTLVGAGVTAIGSSVGVREECTAGQGLWISGIKMKLRIAVIMIGLLSIFIDGAQAITNSNYILTTVFAFALALFTVGSYLILKHPEK